MKICGCMCNILPDVIEFPEKSEAISNFLDIEILFDKIRFELDISVVMIFGTVIVVAVILLRFDVPVTDNVPVLILLLLTVLKIEIPDICRFVVEILVDLMCVASRFVVVCVVFDNNGTVRLVLLCIFPVLRLLLFTVPRILILVITRFVIVEEVAVNRFSLAKELECNVPVLKLLLATVPNIVLFNMVRLLEVILVVMS